MAATPESESDLKTLATVVIKSFEQVRMLGSKNSATQSGTINITNVVAMQATLDGVLKGTNLVASAGIFAANRANIVAFLAQAGAALQNQFVEYAKVLGYAGNVFGAQFANVFRDYATNSKAVQSRGFVFGSPAAGGSNVGTGTIVRLNIDEWGAVIENQTSDAKLARCTQDATSTASLQQEVFTLEGSPAGRDALEEYGSGKTVAAGGGLTLVGLSALNSTNYGVQNASFSATTPAAVVTNPTALTDLPNWTVGGGGSFTSTNFQVSRSDGTAGTDYYRGFQGDTTPVAIKASQNAWTLTQNLTLNGAKFTRGGCYYFHIAICRRSSADGTFTLTVGNSTVTVDLTTLVNDTWAVLKIAVDKKTYYRNFGSSSVSMTFGRSSGTTGTVDFDDITVGAFQRFDGGFYALVGGPVPFVVEDSFTFTDTECSSAGRTSEVFSITQRWLTRGFGGYLPAAPLPPVNVPTVAQSSHSGSCTSGNHFLACSFVDVYGRESALGPPSLAVTVDGSHNVDVSNLDATAPSYVATIKVYMARQGVANTGPYYYTGISGAAGTTSFTGAAGVAVADGSLTVLSKSGITFADPT